MRKFTGDVLSATPQVTYDPSMDRSSPSAAESASEVSAALDPRAAEMSADIYGLIVREIPQLRSDKRVLALLESSVAENVATVLHILQHGIDLEKVHAPAAAEEYARRLAQRGVPIAALLRAYRIGSARFEDWCLQELGRQHRQRVDRQRSRAAYRRNPGFLHRPGVRRARVRL